MLIIDHLAAVHQGLDACDNILGVLSWPGHNIFQLTKAPWVLTSCVIPCWIWSRKAEALALVAFCSSLLPVGIHCACISRDLVPRAAKTYLRWSLLSGQYAVEEEPVLQGMAKYGEGVVCILGVPVIDGQAY